MTFYIQDPEDADTTYLFEALVAAAADAVGGGGAFAWATARGVDLLFQDDKFNAFATDHKFDLIVGLDAVTNELALSALQKHLKALPSLNVDVFFHDYSGCLFHPKFSWFRHKKGGKLISGSGNLTEGGLRGNWEAFSVTDLDDTAIAKLEQYWDHWKTKHSPQLIKPDDPQAIERARQNIGWTGGAVGGKRPPGKKAAVAKKVAANAPAAAGVDNVLVAEIPKGSTRWNQANFDKENYEQFFGAKVGTQRMMFFRHIGQDGSVAKTEVRPSVAVKSHNWRFELAAAAGISYPTTGRPIAVFVAEAVRTFRYQLLLPSDAGHSTLAKFLDENWSGRADRIKRIRTTASALQKVWPTATLWNVEDLVIE